MNIFTFTSQRVSVAKAARRGPRREVTKTYKKLSALSKQMGNAVRVDLVKGIKTFKKQINSEDLYQAWAKGDYGKVLATIPWERLPQDIDPAFETIGDTVSKAAAISLLKLPPNINENLRFDVTNPTIRNYMNTRTGSLIVDLQEGAQQVIQSAVARAFTEAQTPRQVAEQIKSSIGLLPQHAEAVRNYARGLQDRGYPPGNLIKYSEAYADRLLDYRATMIARTETRMATNQGQLAIWNEGVNQGYIDRASAQKEWVVDGDPCEVCEPMDGERVGLDEPWIIEYLNGEMKPVQIPTEAHPHCYCGMELHFGQTETESSGEQDSNED